MSWIIAENAVFGGSCCCQFHKRLVVSLSRFACAALVTLVLTACQTVGGETQPKRFSTAVDQVAVTPSSKITVVYVGAYNCPYCLSWESAKDSVIARLRAKGVEYREAVSPSYSNTSAPYYWPDDLKWITTQNAAFVARGTPRFLVLVDNAIVANQVGLGNFPEDYINQLVAARTPKAN